MMGHLLAVKEKQVQTDDMFGPLLATFELLKTYGQQLSEEVYIQLQVHFITFASCTMYSTIGYSISEQSGVV